MAAGASGSAKRVLVCLGERKRGTTFEDPGSPEEKRKVLVDAIRKAYADVPSKLLQDDFVLQLKDETWGEFIDCKADEHVPNRGVLRIVSEVSEVR